MSLIDILIRLLMAIFSLFFFGVEGSPPQRPAEPPDSSSAGAQPIQSFVNIRNVEVIVLESFPMQVQLHITGDWPTGCEFPTQIDQQIEANTAVVKIYQEMPPDIMCPMILRPYDDTITLDGNFEPGNYVFQVNDYVVTQTL